jgi:hypothetical protein
MQDIVKINPQNDSYLGVINFTDGLDCNQVFEIAKASYKSTL